VLGSRVIAELQLTVQDALVAPRSAVLTQNGQTYVYLVDAGKARRVSVKQIIDNGKQIAISGAVHAGDEIVVTGNYELTDGMAVRETP